MTIKEKIDDFHSVELQKAIEINNEVSFYSELHADLKAHPYYYTFTTKLHTLYHSPAKEQRMIEAYLNNRIPTVEICDTIFSTLKDVFDSQNQNIAIKVKGKTEAEVKAELFEYFEYFKNEGWEYLKTKLNSFLVVDIKDGKPYIYNVLPQYVKNLKLDENKNVKEIIFSFDDKIFYEYTDFYYAKYEKTTYDYAELELNTHNIGKCPVNVFLYDYFNSNTEILRKHNVVQVLDLLYWYSIKYAELRASELESSNHTKVMPANTCHYSISDTVCKGGLMYKVDDTSLSGFAPVRDNQGNQHLCPNCGYNKHIGVGAVITMDMTKAANDNIDIDNLIHYFQPPMEGLEFSKTGLLELENKIIKTAVGKTEKVIRSARNKDDVYSDLESTTKILTQFAEYYAKTIEFAYDIAARIKYKSNYEYCNIYLGNKFYLLSKDELIAEKKEATNPVQRAEIDLKIFKLDFKHDPEKLLAITRIFEIMPYSGTTDTDFIELIKLSRIPDFDIEFRMNIVYYINEFMRLYLNPVTLLDKKLIYDKISLMVGEKLNKRNINTVAEQPKI